MVFLYKVLSRSVLLLLLLQITIFPQGEKFVHVADSSNISFNWTVIDHPLLNGNPDAIFFTTDNWNPGGIGGIYNDANTGVWYTGTNWAIFNQDISNIPEGAAFNIFIHTGTDDFVHTAAVSNTTLNWTVIDHPALNGNPGAVFIITPTWNPGGTGNTYNDAATGVWYTGTNWAIFNQDETAMPLGASFNVYVPSGSDKFVHTAVNTNIFFNWTVIDDTALNGDPDAVFFVTPVWNPGGTGGTYNDAATGVWYDGLNWSIYNQDISDMPENASFNIYLASNEPSGIEEDIILSGYMLEQNYPNPFNPSTSVKFTISEPGAVNLKVYDLLGKEVMNVVNEHLPAGNYSVNIDADGLASGVYFYRLQAGSFAETKKMILIK